MTFLLLTLFIPLLLLYTSHLRRHASPFSPRKQRQKRIALLEELGLGLEEVGRRKVLGFFHPYCNAGGGGERVLWTAIAYVQRTQPETVCVVYTGDLVPKQEILDKVMARFAIPLSPNTLSFIPLHSRHLVHDSTWPRFTLLGQSLGSMVLGWEAMAGLVPDVFIDTMGYAFTYPVVSYLTTMPRYPLLPFGAYIHYPTISTSMLTRVRERKAGVTNSEGVTKSGVLSFGKLIYYRLIMYLYSLSLSSSQFNMVNSTWTKNHVDSVLGHKDLVMDLVFGVPPLAGVKLGLGGFWWAREGTTIVYPPCDTKDLVGYELGGRERVILSVAQFRPEKDHAAQLRAFAHLLDAHPEYREGKEGVKLVLVGGARDEADLGRVEGLKKLARELGVEAQTTFILNAPYSTVLHYLSVASIGLSTMVDEHFGINVVEFMAAGVIPVAHASGGPLLDIVVPYKGEPTGYHATTPETFSSAFHTILTLPPDEERAMRERAKAVAVERFSEEEFEKGWEGVCGAWVG
ncbi:glycosyltransferase family 4 protein [Jaapia argillacea MUCL 33604]|uniref:GDP-Man:Man(3)GlcNAc(2)-PP-Dol alpha-1,2-mannosyltransferase n=1 Tax=Jaapia argillacea MUCL 33604 TaxID=933084 RepID=A0A067QF31_9AGAM|nr:glycosyltransferase family 4 protein [Jaapia argillacea MUCL 33604]